MLLLPRRAIHDSSRTCTFNSGIRYVLYSAELFLTILFFDIDSKRRRTTWKVFLPYG